LPFTLDPESWYDIVYFCLVQPEFEGYFTVFNEADEHGMLQKFFEHIQVVILRHP
jgi:hypothetical protein